MCKYVFPVQQMLGAYHCIGIGELLFVHRHAAALSEFAHLALRGKHAGCTGKQFDGRDACFDYVFADLELWNAFKHRQQCVLVDAVQNVLSLV